MRYTRAVRVAAARQVFLRADSEWEAQDKLIPLSPDFDLEVASLDRGDRLTRCCTQW